MHDISRQYYLFNRWDHHGFAVPAVGAIPGTIYGRSVKNTVRMDTTAIDETLALDASKGTDGCYSRHCTLELVCFH
jgi:hypothetical protein